MRERPERFRRRARRGVARAEIRSPASEARRSTRWRSAVSPSTHSERTRSKVLALNAGVRTTSESRSSARGTSSKRTVKPSSMPLRSASWESVVPRDSTAWANAALSCFLVSSLSIRAVSAAKPLFPGGSALAPARTTTRRLTTREGRRRTYRVKPLSRVATSGAGIRTSTAGPGAGTWLRHASLAGAECVAMGEAGAGAGAGAPAQPAVSNSGSRRFTLPPPGAAL